MHKYLLPLALLAGSAGAATAQTTEPLAATAPAAAARPDSAATAPRLAVGVVGGLTRSSMLGSDATTNYSAKYKFGFLAGLTFDLRLSPKLTLHPEARYTWKGSTFADAALNRNLSYLDVPVLVRFHEADFGRNTLYLEAGPQFSALLTAETDGGADAKAEFRDLTLGFAMGAGYRFANGLSLGLRYDLDITHTYQEVPPAASLGRGNYQPNSRNDVFSAQLGYSLKLK
jgi:opacity protein-like surface antigen